MFESFSKRELEAMLVMFQNQFSKKKMLVPPELVNIANSLLVALTTEMNIREMEKHV